MASTVKNGIDRLRKEISDGERKLKNKLQQNSPPILINEIKKYVKKLKQSFSIFGPIILFSWKIQVKLKKK